MHLQDCPCRQLDTLHQQHVPGRSPVARPRFAIEPAQVVLAKTSQMHTSASKCGPTTKVVMRSHLA